MQASTAGRTFRTEMKDTSAVDQVGREGQLSQESERGRSSVDDGDAWILAQRPVELAIADIDARDLAPRRA